MLGLSVQLPSVNVTYAVHTHSMVFKKHPFEKQPVIFCEILFKEDKKQIPKLGLALARLSRWRALFTVTQCENLQFVIETRRAGVETC